MGQKENREEFREPSPPRQGTEADLDPLGSCFPLSPEAINCLDSTSTRQKSSLLLLGAWAGVSIVLPPPKTMQRRRFYVDRCTIMPSKPNIICVTGLSCQHAVFFLFFLFSIIFLFFLQNVELNYFLDL